MIGKEMIENALRYVRANCRDIEQIRDYVERNLKLQVKKNQDIEDKFKVLEDKFNILEDKVSGLEELIRDFVGGGEGK